MYGMFKYYMELYIKMLENITNYYKLTAKIFESYFAKYNTDETSVEPKEGTFWANGHDIYNYIARYGISNIQIQAVLKFDGKLDFDKLKQAVRLSVDSEPVFKSRFVEDERPYWKIIENIGIVDFCTLLETDDIERAVDDFIQTPMDLDKDPMVKVKLIRSGHQDVLGIKINHACCDGAGVKEYIQLLSQIYTSINQENVSYVPTPRIAGRTDQDRLFEDLGMTNPDLEFMPGTDVFHPMWPFPWEPTGSNIARVSVCRLPVGCLAAMREYVKRIGVTLNDYILTACYRAMLRIKQPIYGSPMEFPITIDLRRYLSDHKTQAIRNFSGSVRTELSMNIDEPFEQTLQRASNMMKELKNGYPGLQSAIGLERIERLNYSDILSYYQAVLDPKKAVSFCPLYYGDKCVPTLSNIGYLSNSLIKFDDKTVIDAYVLPPVVRAPGLLLMASSYDSVLTLAAGYYKSTVNGEYIDELLNKIKDELISGYEG